MAVGATEEAREASRPGEHRRAGQTSGRCWNAREAESVRWAASWVKYVLVCQSCCNNQTASVPQPPTGRPGVPAPSRDHERRVCSRPLALASRCCALHVSSGQPPCAQLPPWGEDITSDWGHPNDLTLTPAPLYRPCLQIRSHSGVSGVRTTCGFWGSTFQPTAGHCELRASVGL